MREGWTSASLGRAPCDVLPRLPHVLFTFSPPGRERHSRHAQPQPQHRQEGQALTVQQVRLNHYERRDQIKQAAHPGRRHLADEDHQQQDRPD